MTVNVLHNLLVDSMSLVPRPVIWRFSRRYIAGTGIEDAYKSVKELNERDCSATVDVLGEDSNNEQQVVAAEFGTYDRLGVCENPGLGRISHHGRRTD